MKTMVFLEIISCCVNKTFLEFPKKKQHANSENMEDFRKVQRWNGPNRLRFLLTISSQVTVLLGSFSIMLLFVLMAKLGMVRNM